TARDARAGPRERSWAPWAAPPATQEPAGSALGVIPAVLDNAARNMALISLARRRFYDAIRSNTLAVDTAHAIKDSIHAAFRRMSALYPDAKYADVYFLIGRMSSGGT